MKPLNFKNITPRKLSLRRHTKSYWTMLKNMGTKNVKQYYY